MTTPPNSSPQATPPCHQRRPDLIGIAGDAANGYQLDEYTSPAGRFGDYAYANHRRPRPEPRQHGRLAQLHPDRAQPGGNTVLFALNTASGALWEATIPANHEPSSAVRAPGPASPCRGHSATVPTLLDADVTRPGPSRSGPPTPRTPLATDYTLTGTTATAGAANEPARPGPRLAAGRRQRRHRHRPTAAATTPAHRGQRDWVTDPLLKRPVPRPERQHRLPRPARQPGQLRPPRSRCRWPSRPTPGSSGILVGTGNAAPASLNPSAMPVMYIGTDGHLYAQFWNG